MGTVIDIFIIVLVFLSLLEGFWKGFYKKIISLGISCLIFFGLYFILKETLVDYFRYSLIYDVTKGAGIVVNINESFTIRVTTLEDLFVVLQNFDSNLSGLFLKGTCESFCKNVVMIISVLVCYLTGGLITTILYNLIFKWFYPKNPSTGKRTPGMFMRILGGVVSTLQAVFLIYLAFVMFFPLNGLADFVPRIYDKLILIGDQFNNPNIKLAFDYFYQFLKMENSFTMKAFLNFSPLIGIDPYNLFSFTLDGTEYGLHESLQQIGESALKVLENISSSQPQTPTNDVLDATNNMLCCGISILQIN